MTTVIILILLRLSDFKGRGYSKDDVTLKNETTDNKKKKER